jgi:uncharacterized protein
VKYKRLLASVATAALGAVALAGCFSPRADPSRFFVLSPAVPEAANSLTPTGSTGLSHRIIGLGPIKLPSYLDRDEVATRVSPNRLEYSDRDRWAEPLDNNFQQVIAQDLTQILGTRSIIFFPWLGNTRIDYQVRIDVYRFENDSSGNAQLVAHWQVLDGSGQFLYANDSDISEPVQSGQSVAAALSRTMDGLARQIASAIRSLSQGGQPGQT